MKEIKQSKILELAAQCINAGTIQRFPGIAWEKTDYYPSDWDVTEAYKLCVVGLENYFRQSGYTIINDMEPTPIQDGRHL